MKTKILLTSIFTFIFFLSWTQIPKGFNYQAIARDANGNVLTDLSLPVRILLETAETGGILLWEESHVVRTNKFGLISFVIGTGKRLNGSIPLFASIDWSAQKVYLRTFIQYPGSTWTEMGTTQIWSVPYSLVADKANGVTPGAKLSVTGINDTDTEALFEVKRKDGQTVFAVYPDAVNVFVPRSTGKGTKGGFAVSGFENVKADPENYFRVTPDSVRIYIDPSPPANKGSKGGFAVGGYGSAKGIDDMYFNLTGASDVNTVASSPQILWYPRKNAFLAGNVHIGSPDSVGNYSTALGYQSVAMGNYSQAFGYKAMSLGDYSTSIGKNSVAGSRKTPLANNAFAFGNAALASGNNSIAFGNMAQATNTNAVAMGNGTIASGTNSTAIGYQAQAQSDKSISIGSFYSTSYPIPVISSGKGGETGSESKGLDDFLIIRPVTKITTLIRTFNKANIASGQYSLAVGNGNQAQNGGLVFGSNSDALKFGALALGTSATANEANSTAMGYNSIANGIYSVAIGNNVTANSYGELALGQWNESVAGTPDTWNENELLFSLGNGINNADRSNALTIYKNGKTIIRGRYAVSTFNYQRLRLTGVLPNLVFKDYVYGIYTNLNRDNPAIEYYYSGWFGATGSEGLYYGLYADSRSGASIDVAEYIYDTYGNTEAADVVAADPKNKESVVKSGKPFQSEVLGVISTKPHMTMGMELVIDEKTGEPHKDSRPATRLALTGRVPVKICNENGPVVPGDYITTSSIPGVAMKWSLLDVNSAKDFEDLKRILAENERRRNAIVGKAVDSFQGSGTGKIMVLISLQ